MLEAACGTGSFLEHLKDTYDVSGFDVSEGMVEQTRAKLPGVPVFQADMADFTLDTPVDAVIWPIGNSNPLREV